MSYANALPCRKSNYFGQAWRGGDYRSTDAGGHSVCSPVTRQQGTVRDLPAPQDGCKGGIYDVSEEINSM